jgi:hypothetical protein
MRKFTAPSDEYDFEDITLRELRGVDEVMAAVMAERNLPSALRDSSIAAISQEQREAQRLSIVAVNGVPTNQTPATPYMDLDEWSQRSLRLLAVAYTEVNGVSSDELQAFRAGAVVVGDGPVPDKTSSESPAGG